MTAEVGEELVHGVELLVQVDGGDAAAGADAQVALDGHDQRRAVIALRDAARGQAEDAAMPPLACQDDHALAAGNLRFRGLADLQLDLLALDVHPVELRAESPRPRRRRSRRRGRWPCWPRPAGRRR